MMENDILLKSDAMPADQLWTFTAILIFFSCLADTLNIHSGANTMTYRFIMWTPGAAALATCCLFGISPRTLFGTKPATLRSLVSSYLLPGVYAIPVYIVAWSWTEHAFAPQAFEHAIAGAYNLASWPWSGTWGIGVPLLLTVGALSGLTWALGEELGWRGFVVPRLMPRCGFVGTSLVIGFFWAAWHFPELIWGDYNAGTNPIFAASCFTIMCVAMSFVMTWLRITSQSVWPCAVLHASHNLLIQAILDPLTANIERVHLFTTEFGAGIAVTMCFAALFCWRRRAQLHNESIRM
jgi:membrane protease YdiL (CAAX protease family)